MSKRHTPFSGKKFNTSVSTVQVIFALGISFDNLVVFRKQAQQARVIMLSSNLVSPAHTTLSLVYHNPDNESRAQKHKLWDSTLTAKVHGKKRRHRKSKTSPKGFLST